LLAEAFYDEARKGVEDPGDHIIKETTIEDRKFYLTEAWNVLEQTRARAHPHGGHFNHIKMGKEGIEMMETDQPSKDPKAPPAIVKPAETVTIVKESNRLKREKATVKVRIPAVHDGGGKAPAVFHQYDSIEDEDSEEYNEPPDSPDSLGSQRFK
jgi:hypothetical protein